MPYINLPVGDTTGFTLYRAARETTTRGDASRVAGEIEAGTFDTAAGNLESANQVTMESAMKEFLRTGNTQKLIDEADAVRASQGIAPSAADPGAPKPGYRASGDRIVAIIRRNSDPTDPKNVRVISNKQIEAGLGYRALLGKAKEEDWGIFSVPRGTRARDVANNPSIAVADSISDSSSLNALPEGHPQAVHEPVETWNARTLELINDTDDAAFEHIFRGDKQNFKMFRQMFGPEYFTESGNVISITGEGLDAIVLRLIGGERDPSTGAIVGAWAQSPEEHAFRVDLLGKLLAVRAEAAPSGIRRADDDLAESITSLGTIFDGYDEASKYVARDVLERVSKSYAAATGVSGRAPVLDTPPVGQDGMWGTRLPSSGSAELNTIEIGATGLGNQRHIPDASKLVHEVMHWAWFNVLTDADQIQFLSSMRKYYTNGILDINKLALHTADTLGPDNTLIKSSALDSPFELFAHMGERWAMQNRYREQIGNEAFWTKIVNYVKNLFLRYMDGSTIDPDMAPLFDKILPASEADAARTGRATTAPSVPAKSPVLEGMVLKHALQMDNLAKDVEEALDGGGDPLDAAADLASLFWVLAGGKKGAKAFKGGGRDRFNPPE